MKCRKMSREVTDSKLVDHLVRSNAIHPLQEDVSTTVEPCRTSTDNTGRFCGLFNPSSDDAVAVSSKKLDVSDSRVVSRCESRLIFDFARLTGPPSSISKKKSHSHAPSRNFREHLSSHV